MLYHNTCESDKAGAREDNSESALVQAIAVTGFHVDCRVWLPHIGQPLRAEREHGNTEDRLQSLSESTVTLELTMINLQLGIYIP